LAFSQLDVFDSPAKLLDLSVDGF